MAHTLKSGIKAQKRRAQSRALSPKTKETSIPFEAALRNTVLLSDGTKKTIDAMTDDEFRSWFYGIIEAIAVHIKPDEHKVQDLINKARRESYDLPLEISARWYLTDMLYGTSAFQRSGIEIFVREEVVA